MQDDGLPPGPTRGQRAFLIATALGAVAFWAWYVWETSFLVGGERYFALFDDAMISMRYGQTIARGGGVAWYPGAPPLEGFSNPLQVLLMVGANWLPLPPRLACLPVQAVGVAISLALVLATHRLARELTQGDWRVANAAALGVAAYVPLHAWTLWGFEVGSLALVSTLAGTEACRVARGLDRVGALAGLLALATFIRFDGAVLVVPIAVTWALQRVPGRGRALLRVGATIAAALLAQTLVRFGLFGAPLPNTFWLKLTGYPLGLRVERGALVLWDFLWTAQVWTVLLPLGVALLRPRGRWLLPVLLMATQCAYSAWVGGDAWEQWHGANRYVSIGVPGWVLCVALLGAELGRRTARWGRAATWLRPGFELAWLAAVVGPFVPLGVEGNALGPATPYDLDYGLPMVEQALALQRVTEPTARVAVVWAGTVPFFAERPTLNLLGRVDARVAQGPMHQAPPGVDPGRWFLPGHLKWDYEISLTGEKPDVILQLWGRPEDAAPWLGEYERHPFPGRTAWFRRGSPLVRWEELPHVFRDAPRPRP